MESGTPQARWDRPAVRLWDMSQMTSGTTSHRPLSPLLVEEERLLFDRLPSLFENLLLLQLRLLLFRPQSCRPQYTPQRRRTGHEQLNLDLITRGWFSPNRASLTRAALRTTLTGQVSLPLRPLLRRRWGYAVAGGQRRRCFFVRMCVLYSVEVRQRVPQGSHFRFGGGCVRLICLAISQCV
jgi:hypothetical protein